ncbi:MAG: YIP1 family protein [Spirochaetales bacterium]|uniref:YIP1 family protein n=1 Tax=Candidatus Thalassospirochaeta sargassi TaxID=3119039 RepID=A0AAJ1MJ22_9SPIO|nr:YIP1 family protein [Spirochaetales bacterium]
MKKTFVLWTRLFISPTEGFSDLTPQTPIILPVLSIVVLVLAGMLMLMPIIGSETYTEALGRVQINTLAERGTEMSAEQLEVMQEQLHSGRMRTFTMLSSTVGGAFTFFLMLLVNTLFLLILTRIFGSKPSFKHLFKILVFLAAVSSIQAIIKNGITLMSDYERLLSRVQYAKDMQWAITSPVSLAVLFAPGKLSILLYTLIDSITDIFNWIYFIYLYFAMRFSLSLPGNKAIGITILAAALMIGISLIFASIV